MKKRSFLLLFCLLFAGSILTAQTFGGGSGTATDPYIIKTAAQLNDIRNINWGNVIDNKPYFRLEADIDLSGIDWLPINSESPYCHVYFDGNGHVIKNMTVNNATYGSLFGVLCGSCKNLGVINADVISSNGSGIIAGYVGLKSPTSAAYTGIIENSFTTGKIVGSGAAGGIVGNIGKPYNDTPCIIRNCYSTADVSTSNETGTARAGGIAGIVYDRGILMNCYATGNITSSIFAAGGIAGWSDANIVGCVARNKSINNATTGKIGRISSTMGQISGVIAQGVNCWGKQGMVLNNGGVLVSENDLITGVVTVKEMPYDGVSKTEEYLSDPLNYFLELEWDFASDNNVWAQTMSNGYPIFQWLFDRGDYEQIDGLNTSSVNQISLQKLSIRSEGNTILINNNYPIEEVSLYSITGEMLASKKVAAVSTSVQAKGKGVYIVKVKSEGNSLSQKIVIK